MEENEVWRKDRMKEKGCRDVGGEKEKVDGRKETEVDAGSKVSREGKKEGRT